MVFFKESIRSSVQAEKKSRTRRVASPVRQYHKYFNGFVERKMTKPNGRQVVRRVYVEDYYSPDITDVGWVAYKLEYCLMVLATVFLFYKASSMRILSNTKWYLTVLQAVFVVFAAATILSLLSYLFSKKKMTIYEYHVGPCRLKKSAAFAGTSGMLLAVCQVIMAVIWYKTDGIVLIVCAGMYLLSGAIFLLISHLERNLTYERVENSNRAMEDDLVL